MGQWIIALVYWPDLGADHIKKACLFDMDIDHVGISNQGGPLYCLTDGVGADGSVIYAVSSSRKALSVDFQMCRKKGRVVLSEDVCLDLNRSDIHHSFKYPEREPQCMLIL